MRREEKVQEAKEKKNIRFVVCHIKTLGKIDLCRVATARLTAKFIFAVCQQLGTRQQLNLPCVFWSHSANLIYRVLNFCRQFLWPALGIYWVCRVPMMLLTVKSQAHGKVKVSRSVRQCVLDAIIVNTRKVKKNQMKT